ncbi:hypothetical protein JCM8097_003537 [Rhodosporidiobolus ruineniae]
MSDFPADTQNPHACRWKFCSDTFPSAGELQSHVAAHVEQAQPHPKAERDEERELERHYDASLAGATVGGHRPAIHEEASFPEFDRKTGVVSPPQHHPDAPK